MNVVILAGGEGTRLRGLWDKPKCLVPYKDGVVLDELLKQVREAFGPGTETLLLLGHGFQHVRSWLAEHKPDGLRVSAHVDKELGQGTAVSVRNAILHWLSDGPLLVMNGDTIPFYPMSALAGFAEASAEAREWGALAWNDHRYAGQAIINEKFQSMVAKGRATDFDAFLMAAEKFYVPGFLDVGTPEGFRTAIQGARSK